MSPSPLQRLRSSPTWRYAVVSGLVSIPLTLALNWPDFDGTWDASGIVLCALAVGYLAKRRGLGSTAVGARAGAVGALPLLWSIPGVATYVLGLTQPAWFTALSLVLLAAIVPLLFGFAALVGGVAGRLGGWLAERSGHPQTPVGS